MLSRVPEPLLNIAHIQKINDWQTWPRQFRDARPMSALAGNFRHAG
jgi:hypothetical protein